MLFGDFETKYKIIENKKSLVSKMRMIITEYKFMNIHLGTDDDVEGEKIAKVTDEGLKKVLYLL